VKIIAPPPLVAEAARVLEPVRDEVVVIGAAAVQVVLASDDAVAGSPRSSLTITPTRDVDLAVATQRVPAVVAHLEGTGFEPSEEPPQRGFTWIAGDLKIQLLRAFDPFPPQEAERLPVNVVSSALRDAAHRDAVAFIDALRRCGCIRRAPRCSWRSRRQRSERRALETLAGDGPEARAAARQDILVVGSGDVRERVIDVRRSATLALRQLQAATR
jgi:hypothetical protein